MFGMVSKKHSEVPLALAMCQTRHHTITTQDKANIWEMPYPYHHNIIIKVWKSKPGHFLLLYHCVMIVHECILDLDNKIHFSCYAKMVGFLRSGHNLYFWTTSKFYNETVPISLTDVPHTYITACKLLLNLFKYVHSQQLIALSWLNCNCTHNHAALVQIYVQISTHSNWTTNVFRPEQQHTYVCIYVLAQYSIPFKDKYIHYM